MYVYVYFSTALCYVNERFIWLIWLNISLTSDMQRLWYVSKSGSCRPSNNRISAFFSIPATPKASWYIRSLSSQFVLSQWIQFVNYTITPNLFCFSLSPLYHINKPPTLESFIMGQHSYLGHGDNQFKVFTPLLAILTGHVSSFVYVSFIYF